MLTDRTIAIIGEAFLDEIRVVQEENLYLRSLIADIMHSPSVSEEIRERIEQAHQSHFLRLDPETEKKTYGIKMPAMSKGIQRGRACVPSVSKNH